MPPNSGVVDNNEGFTGHIADADTGLTYMQARMYDPVAGRFLSNDPVSFLDSGLNPGMFGRYTYSFNDPVNMVDPDGELPFLAAALANPVVRGAIGGAVSATVGTVVNAGAQLVTTGMVNVNDALAAGGAAGVVGTAVAVNPALAANPAALVALGGASGAAGSVAGDVANGRPVSGSKALVAGIAGAVGSPTGAAAGNLLENAAGAAASSLAGEVGGAVAGEIVAGTVNVAVPAAAQFVEEAGDQFQEMGNVAREGFECMNSGRSMTSC